MYWFNRGNNFGNRMRKKTRKNPLFLLLSGGVFLTIGDIFAAWWVKGQFGPFYFLIMLFYLIGMVLLVRSYKTEDIPVASLILVIFNVVILFFAGIFLFDETINSLKIFGILLCFVSLYLLEFGKTK